MKKMSFLEKGETSAVVCLLLAKSDFLGTMMDDLLLNSHEGVADKDLMNDLFSCNSSFDSNDFGSNKIYLVILRLLISMLFLLTLLVSIPSVDFDF